MKSNAIADERDVSWKVLLPIRQYNRVLALGMSDGELCGLARIFSHVDISPNGRKYDTVIFGDQAPESQPVGKYLSHVTSNSAFIAIGSSRIHNMIRQSGWRCVAEYACLPPSKPRLYLPLTTKQVRKKGLEFHSPGSLQKKTWLWIAKSLSSIGISAHLRLMTLTLFTNGNLIDEEGSLKQWISQRTGWAVDEMAVYAGSDSPASKITVLAMSSDGSKQIVARIADTDLAIAAIRRESAALRVLAQSPLAGAVPALIAAGDHGPYVIQLQSCLPKARGQCRFLSTAHISFLSELSKINRTSVPFRKTREWLFVNDAANTAAVGKLPESMTHIVSGLANTHTAERMVVCHMTHGDFAPWNIIDQKGYILVYDWEDSNPKGFPYHDVFHFIYRQASLVGPWPGANAVLKMMKHAAARLANVSKIMCDPDLALSLWCIKEYFCKPDPRLVDLAGAIAKINHE